MMKFNWCQLIVPLTFVALCACTSATEGLSTAQPATDGRDYGLQIVGQLPPPAKTNEGADQLVAVHDLLQIDVFQVDELDREVRVDSRGRISLALIGAVEAKDKTLSELETTIEKQYAVKYLQNPEISVFMKESAGQRVTVDGEVRKPGIYPVSSTTTLLQLIALAGGLTELADETKLYVFRDVNERNYVTNYSIQDIRNGKKNDPNIYGGDVIVSFRSDAKVAARNLREALGLASSATRLVSPF